MDSPHSHMCRSNFTQINTIKTDRQCQPVVLMHTSIYESKWNTIAICNRMQKTIMERSIDQHQSLHQSQNHSIKQIVLNCSCEWCALMINTIFPLNSHETSFELNIFRFGTDFRRILWFEIVKLWFFFSFFSYKNMKSNHLFTYTRTNTRTYNSCSQRWRQRKIISNIY